MSDQYINQLWDKWLLELHNKESKAEFKRRVEYTSSEYADLQLLIKGRPVTWTPIEEVHARKKRPHV